MLRSRLKGLKNAVARNIGLMSSLALVALGVWFGLPLIWEDTATEVLRAWTAMGVVGFVVTALNFYDALVDRIALRASQKNGLLLETAKTGIRVEVLRLIQTACIAVVGVVVCIVGPTITPEIREKLNIPEWTTTSIVTTGMLFTVIGIIVLQSILDRAHRKRVYEADQL